MALTLETVMRDDLANQMDDSINTGGGTANLKFETAADGEVATINFQNPAFGASVTGTITLQGTPLEDNNADAGTIEHFSIYARSAAKQLEGVVLVAGGDINITSLVIASGDTIELTSFSITVPA
jgi:hypothetical protein